LILVLIFPQINRTTCYHQQQQQKIGILDIK